jgi:hypothetical protein
MTSTARAGGPEASRDDAVEAGRGRPGAGGRGGSRPADRLREVCRLLRRLHGAAAEARPTRAVATGLPALDALLVGGGLARGRLTALAGLGSVALAHRAVAEATRAGRPPGSTRRAAWPAWPCSTPAPTWPR